MEVLRIGKWGKRSYGSWLFPATGWGLEQEDVSPHKKISVWVCLAEGETLKQGHLSELVFSLSRQLFPESEGWDFRELDLELGKGWAVFADYQDPEVPVQAVTLYVGKTAEPAEYTGEEQTLFRQYARRVAEAVFVLADQTLKEGS